MTTDNRQQIANILDATRLLFGERLHGPPSRYPDVRLLLAAIAEAYVRRQSLRKPARVAYINLKRGVDPGSEFLADPLSFLPDDFLAEAGFIPAPQPECESAEAEYLAEVDIPEEPLEELNPSLSLPADAQGRRSAIQVWEIAIQELRDELPRSVFSAYLKGCVLASYDPKAYLFSVSVADEQARRWLEDRLSNKLVRLLAGICDQPCTVRFVTAN